MGCPRMDGRSRQHGCLSLEIRFHEVVRSHDGCRLRWHVLDDDAHRPLHHLHAGEWWKIGFIITVLHIVVWMALGLPIMGILGMM